MTYLENPFTPSFGEVPDKRISVLTDMYHPKSVVPAVMRFVDIARF